MICSHLQHQWHQPSCILNLLTYGNGPSCFLAEACDLVQFPHTCWVVDVPDCFAAVVGGDISNFAVDGSASVWHSWTLIQ